MIGPITSHRLAFLRWEACEKITPSAWVVGYGRFGWSARRALERLRGR